MFTKVKTWRNGKVLLLHFYQNIDFWADENFGAPEVYFYNKQYYMLASFKTKGKSRESQILVADNPLGQFKPLTKEPLTPSEWECRWYIIFSRRRTVAYFLS